LEKEEKGTKKEENKARRNRKKREVPTDQKKDPGIFTESVLFWDRRQPKLETDQEI